jgi:hypothetical protein
MPKTRCRCTGSTARSRYSSSVVLAVGRIAGGGAETSLRFSGPSASQLHGRRLHRHRATGSRVWCGGGLRVRTVLDTRLRCGRPELSPSHAGSRAPVLEAVGAQPVTAGASMAAGAELGARLPRGDGCSRAPRSPSLGRMGLWFAALIVRPGRGRALLWQAVPGSRHTRRRRRRRAIYLRRCSAPARSGVWCEGQRGRPRLALEKAAWPRALRPRRRRATPERARGEPAPRATAEEPEDNAGEPPRRREHQDHGNHGEGNGDGGD